MGLGWQRPKPAPYHHAESAFAVADHGSKTDIVDSSQHAILFAARERNLEFPGQAIGEFLVQERKSYFLRVRMHVENFVLEQPAQRTGRHVADRVVASFARGHADIR